MAYQVVVPSIVCGGCVDTLIKAVTKLDPGATVTGDLETKTLTIESSQADLEAVKTAITEAGHTPES